MIVVQPMMPSTRLDMIDSALRKMHKAVSQLLTSNDNSPARLVAADVDALPYMNITPARCVLMNFHCSTGGLQPAISLQAARSVVTGYSKPTQGPTVFEMC